MKKLIYFALVFPMAMLVIACGEKTKSNPEADSLRTALSNQMAEMNEMDLFLDAVNASMDSVLNFDGTVLRSVGESNLSRKEQIKQNISAYKEILIASVRDLPSWRSDLVTATIKMLSC